MSISFLALALFLVSNIASAQDDKEVRFGVKGGLNLANLYVDNVDDEKAKYGLHAGDKNVILGFTNVYKPILVRHIVCRS